MEYQTLHFLHVFSALLLVGYTFYAFAGPATDTRKKVLIITGLASLVILGTGMRMWQLIYSFKPMLWIFVKMICWLGISAFAGIAYKRREKIGVFTAVTLTLVLIAVAMVYYQPGK